MDFENVSRRSFLKKTTVLTVGIASMSLFSGLVNAADGDDTNCYDGEIGGNYLATQTYGDGGNVCWQSIICDGKLYKTDQWDCPNPADGDQAYQDWLNNCAMLPAGSVDIPHCQPMASED